jgi:hypothetical protein
MTGGVRAGVLRWKAVLALSVSLLQLSCDDCPQGKKTPGAPGGAPLCAYGFPGTCCSEGLWSAVCRDGKWSCDEAPAGYPGGILRDQCRQDCPSPFPIPDAGPPDGPSTGR